MPDADLDKCLPTMIRSSFINQGEVCLTTSRIYVQQEIYQNFLDRFVKMTKYELTFFSTTKKGLIY